MLAKVVRTCNDESIGDTDDERFRWVNEELDYEDGREIEEHVNALLQKVQRGRQQRGKSTPSSGQQTAGAERATSMLP